MNNTVESQNMSVQAIWNIRDARGINANEKTFLFVVASRGIMYSEWQTAAADMGMSKDTYYRTRNSLIKKGLVKEGLRKDTTTVYRIDETALSSLVPVKETSDEIVWLETEQKPAEAPATPEPVSEAQTAPQGPEMTDEEAKRTLEEDDYADYVPEDTKRVENRPAVEKPAKKIRKAKVETPAMKSMTERLAEVKAVKSDDQEKADSILAESDNPEAARRLFSDSAWESDKTDVVQRASYAAFKVEKEFAPTASKTVTDTFDEEW